MPVYLFRHPETDSTREEVQRMTDPHVYVGEDGVEWERVWTIPAAGIDGKINAFSPKDFVEKTRGKGMTVGDLWDASAEFSEKRGKIAGEDPLKKKYFKKYSGDRKGQKHPGQGKSEN